VTIRRADPADLDTLLALEAASFPGDRMSRRAFRHALRSPATEVWVVEEDGGVLACAVLHFRRGDGSARLYSIAVDGKARGRGVAGSLLACLEERALSRGFPELRLEVRSDNAAALRLYERAGYERVAVIPAYYADGEAAVKLRRRLLDGRA
jgi:ribosomal protein S18 acetylase RimI-like enzyme